MKKPRGIGKNRSNTGMHKRKQKPERGAFNATSVSSRQWRSITCALQNKNRKFRSDALAANRNLRLPQRCELSFNYYAVYLTECRPPTGFLQDPRTNGCYGAPEPRFPVAGVQRGAPERIPALPILWAVLHVSRWELGPGIQHVDIENYGGHFACYPLGEGNLKKKK